jgi:hypothetical protein
MYSKKYLDSEFLEQLRDCRLIQRSLLFGTIYLYRSNVSGIKVKVCCICARLTGLKSSVSETVQQNEGY